MIELSGVMGRGAIIVWLIKFYFILFYYRMDSLGIDYHGSARDHER
jgi:hypothetical protein